MSRVASLLTMSEQGYYADLQWLYKFIEKRDATLRAVLARRRGAMKKLDWSIKAKEGRKNTAKQEDFLASVYEGIDNLSAAIEFLALAEFRGFAHLEKHYSGDGDIIHLEPVPQWFWCRHLPASEWMYNPDAINTISGKRINPKDFIIREVENPINEIAVVAFMRKNMSQKDWDGFIETYGIPPLFIELPAGIGNAGAVSIDSTTPWQQLAEKVVSDARGVLPNGAQVKTVPDGSRGRNPFKEHLDYQDQQVVLAATGGLLTTLNQSTGLGSGQSESHENTFRDLAQGEAMDISEVLQKHLDGPLLMEKFPSEDASVYFELHGDELEESSKTIEEASKLSQAGYEIETEQLEEKTGYKLVNKAERQQEQATAQQDAQMFGQFGGGFGNAAHGVPDALANDGRPLLEAVRSLLEVPDDRLSEAMAGLKNRLPALARQAASGRDGAKRIFGLLAK